MLKKHHNLILGMLVLFTATTMAAKQLNIIVILADDMGMDSVSAFNRIGIGVPARNGTLLTPLFT